MRTNKRQDQLDRSKARSLKIQPFIRISRWSRTTVPELTLCGKWLEDLGFKAESRVLVYTYKNRLVIKPDKEE